MNAEMWGMSHEREHEVARVLAGDGELLRGRLAAALERMGYNVLAEQPSLVARRKARGGATTGCSNDILDYPTELVVALKPLGEAATRVTFNYTVRNFYSGTRADLASLDCEADAVAALAVAQLSATACASCGAEATEDSRFCRRCGAPLATPEPAEVEVLRLASGARAAYKNIFPGALALLCAAAVAFFLVTQGSEKALRGALMVLGFGGAAGAFMLLWGLWVLGRTLRAKPGGGNDADATAVSPPRLTAPRVTAALLPHGARASVTESTTELLDEAPRREPVIARAPRGDEGAKE